MGSGLAVNELLGLAMQSVANEPHTKHMISKFLKVNKELLFS